MFLHITKKRLIVFNNERAAVLGADVYDDTPRCSKNFNITSVPGCGQSQKGNTSGEKTPHRDYISQIFHHDPCSETNQMVRGTHTSGPLWTLKNLTSGYRYGRVHRVVAWHVLKIMNTLRVVAYFASDRTRDGRRIANLALKSVPSS